MSRPVAPWKGLVMLGALAAPAALGGEGELAAVCEWVETCADARRPETGSRPNQEACAVALACLGEDRESDSPAGTDDCAACRPISDLLGAPPGRVRRWIEEAERHTAEATAASRNEETRRLQECTRFLRCLLRQTEEGAGTGETAWKEEFERICSHTRNAMTLPDPRLRQLLEDSEKLLRQLKGVDDPRLKVYIKRLEMCRDLFRYVLEVREDP